jgi:hypothetical protein
MGTRAAADAGGFLRIKRNEQVVYQAFMPMLNSRCVALLANDRLERQLVALERRVSRGDKDSIDHPPGGHDDLANVAAGVCWRWSVAR